jgi:hypothetical protein
MTAVTFRKLPVRRIATTESDASASPASVDQ